MAKFMVAGKGEASSEATLILAWGCEQGDRVINQGRRGPVIPVSDNLSISVIHGGSSGGWKSWEVQHLVSWWQGSESMATPSTRLDGQRQGGYYYSRCLGTIQWEDRRKWTKEVQIQEVGGGLLAENCYSAKNSTAERRVITNLEKEIQVAFNFAIRGEEQDNAIWIDRILLGRMIQERTAIGRAIKSLAKFQCCKTMRELVKRGDLKDMMEPPLHGSMASPPVTQRIQGDEDMAAETEYHSGSPSGGYLRLEDSPLGFCPSATIQAFAPLPFCF